LTAKHSANSACRFHTQFSDQTALYMIRQCHFTLQHQECYSKSSVTSVKHFAHFFMDQSPKLLALDFFGCYDC